MFVFVAIYLDPRYMCLLSVENKKKAVEHLLKLWNLKEFLMDAEVSKTQCKCSTYILFILGTYFGYNYYIQLESSSIYNNILYY